MSYANGTPFLNLAQTVGTDHRDWFDENEAKLDLDTKMKTLWDERTSTSEILAALQQSVASLDTDVTSLSGIVSGHTTTIATINESLVLINTALQALNTQVTNKFDSVGIADPYDATHGIYAVGDVVTYNGQRYVCITAVSAAEPFDVSKWSARDIQTELDSVNTSLSQKGNLRYNNGSIQMWNGSTWVDVQIGGIMPNFNDKLYENNATSGISYNASKDCIVFYQIVPSASGAGTDPTLSVNGNTVAIAHYSSTAGASLFAEGSFTMKAGDVLECANGSTIGHCVVFGI